MKVESQTRFIVIELEEKANSLYELIADEIYRPTYLGRAKWKNLVGPQASLQNNCEREGFNAKGDKRFFTFLEQELGLLETRKTTATALTPESALVLEGKEYYRACAEKTRVEMRQVNRRQITERRPSRPWGTS